MTRRRPQVSAAAPGNAIYLVGETYRHARTGHLVVVLDHEWRPTARGRTRTSRLLVRERDVVVPLPVLVAASDLVPANKG